MKKTKNFGFKWLYGLGIGWIAGSWGTEGCFGKGIVLLIGMLFLFIGSFFSWDE